MFIENPDGRPISAIITTLAARAYQGEAEIDVALEGILECMGGLVRPNAPYVPNPVSLTEDFADKWDKPEYRHLRLPENFRQWLEQAIIDLNTLQKTRSLDVIDKKLRSVFAVGLSKDAFSNIPGLMATAVAPKSHDVSMPPAKPWRGD
jgi:hypothetical protein